MCFAVDVAFLESCVVQFELRIQVALFDILFVVLFFYYLVWFGYINTDLLVLFHSSIFCFVNAVI